MGSWEEIAIGWTSLGVLKLMETAASVPAWEYFSLVSLLTLAWLYCILDFHFMSALRGDAIRLFYNHESKIQCQILQHCRVLKERYYTTLWLSSPHLQTCFLYFNGRPPPIKYDRQLYITADSGTIALDWVMSPLATDKVGITGAPQSSASDDTPMIVIIPGLTSDSNDSYVKHIAYSSALKGWRTLVANHRGLGGVSITSDQFYNAGWTEDLRTIIHYVHEKYPQAPLFAIGNSIGANILVKYLGEEGAATPIGAAAAVCCPWDLVVCDRFISRKAIQKIYDMILATGLRQYAKMHQSVLARIADWDLLSKSKTVRDFDQYCTRHTGKYETVDTYYRHCSSAYYLANVAVPLLCFNSLDDPVCTKEAIPWDESIANPNVVLAVTKHGGHLGYFEGITAHSVWWVRALTEYMAVMLPSSLMHKQHEVPDSNLNTAQGSDLDKGPYLRMSSSGEVAAEDLQPASPANTGLSTRRDESREVSLEREATTSGEGLGGEPIPTSQETGMKVESGGQITLCLKNCSEILALQSALSQLLGQLQLSPVSKDHLSDHNVSDVNASSLRIRPEDTLEVVVANHLKESAISALQAPAIYVPVTTVVRSSLTDHTGAVRKLAESRKKFKIKIPEELRAMNRVTELGAARNPVHTTNWKGSAHRGSGRCSLKSNDRLLKGLTGVASQNCRILWLLAYVAVVTSCPLIGAALFFRAQGWIAAFRKRLLK
ncbi:unnamed protein product [Sphagnum jensenii]|uniref:AB hydrolase-1 domain-containing protein n=1 Tax=Sphagnum jensenii TaxID=128206 RepID=A0ABP1B500_9BRYO